MTTSGADKSIGDRVRIALATAMLAMLAAVAFVSCANAAPLRVASYASQRSSGWPLVGPR